MLTKIAYRDYFYYPFLSSQSMNISIHIKTYFHCL